MKNRNDRLMAIRKIIGKKEISSQEELLGQLEKQGFSMTQATLSRDLKYLKVAKMPAGDSYVYLLPDNGSLTEELDYAAYPFSGFVSLDFAQGMGLMRTLPGHAGSIAYAIDQLNAYEIAGTIAGDDTILIIPRDGVTRSDLLNLLKRRIPVLNKNLAN